MRITLPWPPSELTPNAKRQHRFTTKTRNGYKLAASVVAEKFDFRPSEHARLELTFCPPDRRRRDLDNWFAACKHALDAIAAYAGVDDRWWSFTLQWGEPRPGGAVVVRVG